MKTVILLVAGKGTRLLPLTKATPKELLPVYDKPVIQFAIDEAVEAGAERLVVITHSDKPAITNYFKTDAQAIAALRQKNKNDLADVLNSAGASNQIEVIFVEQETALGLGHAILCAADFVLDGPVGIILPDDVILGAPCLAEMKDAYVSGHMVAAMSVKEADVPKYGIFDVVGPLDVGSPVSAKGMVEKPTIDEAPSCLAAVGRYILDDTIFQALRTIPRGAGGEYQLTDAITSSIAESGLTAFPFSGVRFDCGNHDGLLHAANARFDELGYLTTMMTAAE